MLTEIRGGGGAHALALARSSAGVGDEPEIVSQQALSDEFPTTPLWSGATRAIRVLRRADIVHSHGVRAGLVARMLLTPPTILTPHGLHALRRSRGMKRVLAEKLTRTVLRSAGYVVCVSESERDDALRLAPAEADRIRLIRNGVPSVPLPTEEERQASRRRLGLPEDGRVLVFLGGIRYQKNPLLAADAFELAEARVPGLVLLVAGEGPLLGDLRKRESDRLRVLGQRDDGHDLLVAADAVLNTSRWEGLSLALLEGLWRGRPLVVTDAPGNADAAGEAGLVAPQEARALADAITELFTRPRLLEALAGRARQRAEALFDERRMLDETLGLYAEVRAWAEDRTE